MLSKFIVYESLACADLQYAYIVCYHYISWVRILLLWSPQEIIRNTVNKNTKTNTLFHTLPSSRLKPLSWLIFPGCQHSLSSLMDITYVAWSSHKMSSKSIELLRKSCTCKVWTCISVNLSNSLNRQWIIVIFFIHIWYLNHHINLHQWLSIYWGVEE